MQFRPTKITLNGTDFVAKDQQCKFFWEISRLIQPENRLVVQVDLAVDSTLPADDPTDSIRSHSLSCLESQQDPCERRLMSVFELVALEIED